MKVRIVPSTAKGEIIVSPSKSYAHRLLIAGALSAGESVIKNVDLSQDIKATINCLEALGKKVEIINDGDNYSIKIKTICDFNNLPEEIIFNCLESGSTLRFFIPLALLSGKKVIFTGTEKLISRGILPYEEICQKQQIEVIKTKNTITFKGKLTNDEFVVPGNISSQFITGLLFALPLLDGNSKIKIVESLESKNYIDITLDVLKQAGIKIDLKADGYEVLGNQKYLANTYLVEGDYSNAAFLEAFNYFGGCVKLKGLNKNSLQGDKVYQEYFASLTNKHQIIDISNCIDLGPILFGFASMMHGGKFLNTERLKIKESNRITAVGHEIAKFGGKIEDFGDFVEIKEQILKKPEKTLNGQNDHRIVMMLAVMASVYGGTIEGAEAVNKSYPHFFKDIESLGIKVEYDVE